MEKIEIHCSAGCGAHAFLNDDGTLPPGWEQLQITARVRCMPCTRSLVAANDLQGTPAEFSPDTLPPQSIGGLKKLPEMPALHEKVKP